MTLVIVLGFIGFILLLLVAAFFTFQSSPNGIATSLISIVVPTSLLYAGICLFLLIRSLSKIKAICQKAKQHDLCLCENCLYPVNCTFDSGVCSECGTEYSTNDLRRRWYMAWGPWNMDEAVHMNIPLSLDKPKPT